MSCQLPDCAELASLYAAPGVLRTGNIDALTPEQRQDRERLMVFEDHYMDCPDCLRRVEAEIAIIEALEVKEFNGVGSNRPRWAYAVAATLLLAVPAAYLVGGHGGGGEPARIIVMSETSELFLDTNRGSELAQETGLPARLWLPASAVALDSDSVAVKIIGADGEVVWEVTACDLDPLGNVELYLPLESLPAGDYEVLLAEGGQSARYPLTIVGD